MHNNEHQRVDPESRANDKQPPGRLHGEPIALRVFRMVRGGPIIDMQHLLAVTGRRLKVTGEGPQMTKARLTIQAYIDEHGEVPTYKNENGRRSWPHRGRLIWPHLVRWRVDCLALIEREREAGRRSAIQGGVVRADQA